MFTSIPICQVWLFSGLMLNLVQLVCFLTIRPINKSLYRAINYYLTYSLWSDFVFLGEWYAGGQRKYNLLEFSPVLMFIIFYIDLVRVFFPDEESERLCYKEHTIMVMNHTYEVDWLWAWFVGDWRHGLAVSLNT